jgi:ribosomal-protein-alanine N-acetyltransferase
MSTLEETHEVPPTPDEHLRFSPLEEQYIEPIHAMEQCRYAEPWSLGMFRQEMEKPFSYFYQLFLNDKLIGYGGFWLVVDEAHITKVTVDENYQGRGFGRALMEFLIQQCLQAGAVEIRLEVRESNTNARTLYSHLGFKEVGLRKGYYSKTNEAAVVMWKALQLNTES